MTQEELDALPEDGAFTSEIRVINGVETRCMRHNSVGALFHKGDEPIEVIDSEGQRWMIGWAEGKKWKRRLRG